VAHGGEGDLLRNQPAHEAADCRSENDAGGEAGADDTHDPGAIFPPRNVRGDRKGHGEAAGGEAGAKARRDQHARRLDIAMQPVGDAAHEQTDEQHRLAAEAVRQLAGDGGGEELPDGECGDGPGQIRGGGTDLVAEGGVDRKHQAEP
jgi:hypothetical protein